MMLQSEIFSKENALEKVTRPHFGKYSQISQDTYIVLLT